MWGGFSFSVDRAGEWAEEGTSKKVRWVLVTFKRTGIRLRILFTRIKLIKNRGADLLLFKCSSQKEPQYVFLPQKLHYKSKCRFCNSSFANFFLKFFLRKFDKNSKNPLLENTETGQKPLLKPLTPPRPAFRQTLEV